MGHKMEVTNVSCKVLPFFDYNITNSCNNGSAENNVQANDRRKTLTRMKKILRWAAAVKNAQRGSKAFKVLPFRNKLTLKAQIDNSSTMSSPKISFRWDVTSCSITSAVYSPLSLRTPTSGNEQVFENAADLQNSESMSCDMQKVKFAGNLQWITTDDEFVVLEL